MAELSPAARAVLDTMRRSYDHEPTRRLIAADVLRAVADQVVPEGRVYTETVPNAGVFVSTEPPARFRSKLLAIAAELEGANG